MECTGKRFRKHGFEFPCGQCTVCRLRVQRMWIARILLENALHSESSFVTLTYDDDHLPANGDLSIRDVQLWLKRLRKVVAVRYVVVGEYGDDEFRPHYHAALFGCADQAVIQAAWQQGFTVVKGIGPESAAYIVSYVLKRRNSVERCDGHVPEFKLQSLRPAIGLRASELLKGIPDGRVVEGIRISGRVYPLGRYLRGKLRTQDGPESEEVIALRHRVAKYALSVRDYAEHERNVENAKRFSEAVKQKRREKQAAL